jgi:glycosyltransferase involved in cell wall biosynthesis
MKKRGSGPTFHVAALPHTITGDPQFSSCAFTGIVERFACAMADRGHRVIHYGNGGSVLAPNVETVEVFSKARQRKEFRKAPWWGGPIREFPWIDANFAAWNAVAREQIAKRASERDFVCIIGGRMQSSLADIPGTMGVEYSIGYEPGGMFSQSHRAFVSEAWRHYCLGATGQAKGDFTDAVIYPPVSPGDFRSASEKDDYLLFLGHVMPTKGIHVAVEVARDAGKRLIVAGAGGRGAGISEPHVECVGVVAPSARAALMGRASAVLMPTTYVEPFGLVAIEAMMSGTPVITTDFGAFTETVIDGVTGYRCRRHQEFVDAVSRANEILPSACRDHAMRLCAPDRVAERYERWFGQLTDLWGDGYYSKRQGQLVMTSSQR